MKSFFLLLFFVFGTVALAQDPAPAPEPPSNVKILVENAANKANIALDWSSMKAEQAADLVEKESPLVLKEFFIYHAIKPITNLLIIFGVALAGVGCLIFGNKMNTKFNKEKDRKQQERYEVLNIVGLVAGCLLLFISFMVFVCSGIDDLKLLGQIYFSPRIFLLNEIRMFIK